jgi:hypothetical protein
MPAEGRPINAYEVLDEGYLEAEDRMPEAPEMLQVGCKVWCEDALWSVQTMVSQCLCSHRISQMLPRS